MLTVGDIRDWIQSFKPKEMLRCLNDGRPIEVVVYFGLLRNLVKVTQKLLRSINSISQNVLKIEEPINLLKTCDESCIEVEKCSF